MASPVPRLDVCYAAYPDGYDLALRYGSVIVELGVLSRRSMIEVVLDQISQEKEGSRVRVYCVKYPGEKTPYRLLDRNFVNLIRSGEYGVEDVLMGELSTFLNEQLRRSVSPLVPARRIPGTPNLLECVFCGRGVVLSQCQTCGREMDAVRDTFRGWCFDLNRALERYPDADRFFVNQPWNPDPPWMSRQDLNAMLKKEI